MAFNGSEPEPRDDVERIMKVIWEKESEGNRWRDLIWNEYPLSDREAGQILARLRSAAVELQMLSLV
jgi:hypothetical protein